jgi:hypothetical protein
LSRAGSRRQSQRCAARPMCAIERPLTHFVTPFFSEFKRVDVVVNAPE